MPRRPFFFFLVVLAALILVGLFTYSFWFGGARTRSSISDVDHQKIVPALQHAVRTIRLNQQPGGYWLTYHTRRPVFQNPFPEVNTFLTPLMLDLLEPAARELGLVDVIERARAFVRQQIEDTGLVRYLGRPDQSHFPPSRCVITPDADDTALAWTLAPMSDRVRLESALRVLEAYRTEEGLYQTWLAPRDAFQCINPGDDPNPVDVGIQMNLYQFFAKYEPDSARRLCEALKEAIVQDRFWVYYAAAPVVPILREVDLARGGCVVHVPEFRQQSVAQEQKVWIDLAQLYGRVRMRRAPQPSTDIVIKMLNSVATGEFSVLKHTPPLLYHNDLSASEPRFYWSADVGYALWLRLYFEALDGSNDTSSVAASIEALR